MACRGECGGQPAVRTSAHDPAAGASHQTDAYGIGRRGGRREPASSDAAGVPLPAGFCTIAPWTDRRGGPLGRGERRHGRLHGRHHRARVHRRRRPGLGRRARPAGRGPRRHARLRPRGPSPGRARRRFEQGPRAGATGSPSAPARGRTPTGASSWSAKSWTSSASPPTPTSTPGRPSPARRPAPAPSSARSRSRRTVPDAERMVAACADAGALLVINHQRRFNSCFRKARAPPGQRRHRRADLYQRAVAHRPAWRRRIARVRHDIPRHWTPHRSRIRHPGPRGGSRTRGGPRSRTRAPGA